MSADLLRRAAVLLRERAETEAILRQGDPYYGDEATAWERIAHPGVGLALADWLDDTAAGWPWDDEVHDHDGNPLSLAESVDSRAIAAARVVLGEAV